MKIKTEAEITIDDVAKQICYGKLTTEERRELLQVIIDVDEIGKDIEEIDAWMGDWDFSAIMVKELIQYLIWILKVSNQEQWDLLEDISVADRQELIKYLAL